MSTLPAGKCDTSDGFPRDGKRTAPTSRSENSGSTALSGSSHFPIRCVREPYQSPTLTVYGTIRDLTQGNSNSNRMNDMSGGPSKTG